MTPSFIKIARVDEIPEGTARVFAVGDSDLEVALCNVGGAIHAIENVCTHDDGPLGTGRLAGATIECPRHGARFDVTTGAVARMPAVVPVRTFPTRVTDGDVHVGIDPDEEA